ncbi:MAG: response regulator, partial [Anaerolineales bacterium]|nr:response regulator [Anaerolineales bacterium]
MSQSILKPKNFEVIIADDGIKGLELALTAAPDLIITDNQMPGMTGLELLSALKQRGVGIPAILMTAHGSEQIAVEAFRLGIRDYVIKPFEPEDMYEAIESALREARLEKERDDLLQKLTDSNAQLQRRLQEINTLYGIGKSVSSSLEIEEVLRRVVDAAVYVTGAEEGSLLLLDEEHGELYVRASKNMESATKSMRLRVDDSLAGQVLRTKKPLVIDDDDRWQKIKTAYLVKSLIYVPLISEGNAVGVLGVSNRRKSASFERRDTRVLAMLADYASIAIRNADHYSRTETERTKLSAILTQSQDPILVLDNDGKVILANQAAIHTLNLPADGRIHEFPIATFVHDNETVAFLQQVSGEGWTPHIELKSRDGRIFNASMSLIEGTGRTIVMHD